MVEASDFDPDGPEFEGDEPPDRIGPYRILEKLGSGGICVVYLAEEPEPVRRRVALKVLKPGMETTELIARFEREGQALALLNHPNIVRLIDMRRTEIGRPYIVMEHVPGVSITQYCDSLHLALDERLRLFLQLCDAVQHVHQKAIIHRSLCSSNILVTQMDGRPTVKLIDFIVCKPLGQTLGEPEVFTEYGQVLGVMEYMSPEQAEALGGDIDTRTDVYSIGALLFELVVGASPFDSRRLRELPLAELRRQLREGRLPTLTERLDEMDGVNEEIARNRRMSVRELLRACRRDLDRIIRKAMEKDRTRRYSTASELAADIGRFLRGEPVQARPPSWSTSVRRFLARRGVQVWTAAALLSVLLLSLAGLSLVLETPFSLRGLGPTALAAITVGAATAAVATLFALHRRAALAERRALAAERAAGWPDDSRMKS